MLHLWRAGYILSSLTQESVRIKTQSISGLGPSTGSSVTFWGLLTVGKGTPLPASALNVQTIFRACPFIPCTSSNTDRDRHSKIEIMVKRVSLGTGNDDGKPPPAGLSDIRTLASLHGLGTLDRYIDWVESALCSLKVYMMLFLQWRTSSCGGILSKAVLYWGERPLHTCSSSGATSVC